MKKEIVNAVDKPLRDLDKNEENNSPINSNINKKKDDEDENDEDDGYTILPSNDSGITADDNAATGKMHEKEGE